MYKPSETNDHVLIEVSVFISIGVPEDSEDIPEGFSEAIRNGIKATGANILTSSIQCRKRQRFAGTAREILYNTLVSDSDKQTKS